MTSSPSTAAPILAVLARRKEEFARDLARQRLILRLVGIALRIAMTLLMLWPLLLR
jgi:hypothetical protein